MSENDPLADSQRLLAAMDFGAMLAADNEKKRKETMELLLGLVEVLDSLHDLEAHCREMSANAQMRVPVRSISIIIAKFLQVLEKSGVVPIPAHGSRLDLDLHEVAAFSQAPDVEDGIVIEELLTGYTWNERLLRRAKVLVSRGEEDDSITA
jgi:molecular chaperone GrpE